VTIQAPERTRIRYEPRGAAERLFWTTAPEVLLDGPAGTGKSLAALWRLHLACMSHPGARCLIVRKVRDTLASTTLATFEERVIPQALATGTVEWFGGSTREPASYRYKNKSRIVIGGMNDPDKIMSSDYDLVFADEATQLDLADLQAIVTRLRHGKLPWQQVIMACNPSAEHHWLNRRAESGETVRLISRHEDNPLYYTADGQLTPEGEAYIVGQLDRLTGVEYLRLRKGLWVAAEGLVYEDYDPAVHLIDSFEIPEDWPRWWVVDFGFRHPFVCQHWAEDPEGILYLYREFFMTGLTVDQHAAEILEYVTEENPDWKPDPGSKVPEPAHMRRGKWTEPMPWAIICDHDAEDRATFARQIGHGTTKANKKVLAGIQATQKRIRERTVFIFKGCRVRRDPELVKAGKPTCTAEEFASYVWADTPEKPKEQPVKEGDDGMDCVRYMVAKKDLGGRPNVRWAS
jgi:PBSX family phage terminase large subunit